ncbi:MAG: HEAT repeat domain-containing protein [Bryobacteraceae bacterium]
MPSKPCGCGLLLAAAQVTARQPGSAQPRSRQCARWALQASRSRGANGLRKLLESPNPSARAAAAWAMGETGDEQFAPALREIVRGETGSIRVQALRALTRIRNVKKAATA